MAVKRVVVVVVVVVVSRRYLLWFIWTQWCHWWGYKYKLFKPGRRCTSSLRQTFFAYRVAKVCNALPSASLGICYTVCTLLQLVVQPVGRTMQTSPAKRRLSGPAMTLTTSLRHSKAAVWTAQTMWHVWSNDCSKRFDYPVAQRVVQPAVKCIGTFKAASLCTA